ncbi:hypothetical protein Q5752_007116 [Cryptotrichosporon argae]
MVLGNTIAVYAVAPVSRLALLYSSVCPNETFRSIINPLLDVVDHDRSLHAYWRTAVVPATIKARGACGMSS